MYFRLLYKLNVIILLLVSNIASTLAEEAVYIPGQKIENSIIKKKIICEPYSSRQGYAFDINSKPNYYDPAFQGYYIESPLYNNFTRYPAFYSPAVTRRYGRR